MVIQFPLPSRHRLDLPLPLRGSQAWLKVPVRGLHSVIFN